MNFICLFFFRIKQFFYILNLIYNLYYLKKNISNESKINYYSDKIIYNVDNIGVFAIKFIQWFLDRLKTIYPEKNYELIYEKFNKYYENCNIHNFEYTKTKYFKSFDSNILDDFEIDKEPLASGSIGQVYKGFFKNKFDDQNNKIKVAIKVIHPNIDLQLLVPKIMLKSFNYLTKKFYFLKNYKIVLNIDDFFNDLEQQINFLNEGRNLKIFSKMYEKNKLIVIPKLYKESKDVLVMSFEEGKFFDQENLSIYQKYKIVSLFNLFVRDQLYANYFTHFDLHNGNWKIRRSPDFKNIYQLIIYDFGLCQKNENQDLLYQMESHIQSENVDKFIDCFFLYNELEQDKKIVDKFKKNQEENIANKKYFNQLNDIIKFVIENGYIVKNSMFYIGMLTNIAAVHVEKYGSKPTELNKYNSKNKNYFFIADLITICKTYDCFPEYCKKLEELFNQNVKDYNIFEQGENFKYIYIDSDSDIETDTE